MQQKACAPAPHLYRSASDFKSEIQVKYMRFLAYLNVGNFAHDDKV